jgi:hypothetical protein
MFHRKSKQKKVEYTGDILVCLDKAYRFSDLKDGITFIGNLTNVNISSPQMKSLGIPLEHHLAVPVFICNRREWSRSEDVDWTKTSSPITELNYSPLQKWWPKAMFRGFSRIGVEEDVVIEYSNFSIKLRVTYAFSKETKLMFEGIEDTDVNLDKIDTFSGNDEPMESESNKDAIVIPDKIAKFIQNTRPFHAEPSKEDKKLFEEFKTEIDNTRQIVPIVTARSTTKEKVALGAGVFTALSLGLYFGIKLFTSRRN